MKLTVLVATYNRSIIIEKCLSALSLQNDKDFEVIVLDQSDDLNTRNLLHNRFPFFKYQHFNEKGKSIVLNKALLSIKSDIICITDDDCVPDKDWIKKIKGFFINNREREIVTGRVIAGEIEEDAVMSKLNDEIDKPTCYQKNKITPIFILSGCNMAFRYCLINEIGEFNNNFGPGSKFKSSDDNEWSYRLLIKGKKIYYEPDIIVIHRSWRKDSDDIKQTKEYGFSAGAFFSIIFDHSLTDFIFHLKNIFKWILHEIIKGSISNKKKALLYIRYFFIGFLIKKYEKK